MIFRQIIHEDLGCASYLVGDAGARVAAVVDPRLEVDDYLALADYLGVEIEHVLETHIHADHVSGNGRLRSVTGAAVHIHRDAAVEYEHNPIDDGWELQLGDVRLRAMHTPGHRPEHTAFAVSDAAAAGRPWGVLTGDTLFVGDVARPDLAVAAGAGARAMFHSLHDKLLRLDDGVQIWPGHLGGSLCGGTRMDQRVASTLGYERSHDPLLRISDESEFVDRLTSGVGSKPPNLQAIVELNRRSDPAEGSRVEPLTAHDVYLRQAAGALVVDVRSDRAFDAAHIPGAVYNPAGSPGFGTRLGWIAAAERAIIMVGHDDSDARHASCLAASVGLQRDGGWLAGGMASWIQHFPTASIPRVTAVELHRRLASEPRLQVLDVRDRDEWAAGAIPGALRRPYSQLDGLPAGLDPGHPVAVVCSSGRRSAMGASLVKHHGAQLAIHVVDGGVDTWAANGWPLERPADTGGR